MSTSSLNSVPSTTSGSRGTPLHMMSPLSPGPYKPLQPSASVLSIFKSSDDELRHRGIDDLVRVIRHLESETSILTAEHNGLIKDVNRKIQINLLEIKGLKEINQKLQDDNQELRDLCCFLDDDRQRSRKLAREWQRFGRYTASVMRSEVAAYQEKLKDLEQKQEALVSDNAELKELCLYLDQERMSCFPSHTRDEGDGSSNSTANGNDELPPPPEQLLDEDMDIDLTPVPDSEERDSYILELETKVKTLEEEKSVLNKALTPSEERRAPVGIAIPEKESSDSREISPSKPEAVVRAMKVLEVHEQLERPQTDVGEENLGDTEKAIVREMCNVVWRKLGDVTQQQPVMSTDVNVYENLPRTDPPEPNPPNSCSVPTHSQQGGMTYQLTSSPSKLGYEGKRPTHPGARDSPSFMTKETKTQDRQQNDGKDLTNQTAMTFRNQHSMPVSDARNVPKGQNDARGQGGSRGQGDARGQNVENRKISSSVQHQPVHGDNMQSSSSYSTPRKSHGNHVTVPEPGTSHTVHAHAIPSPKQYRSPPPPPPPPTQLYEQPLPPTYQALSTPRDNPTSMGTKMVGDRGRHPPPPVPVKRSLGYRDKKDNVQGQFNSQGHARFPGPNDLSHGHLYHQKHPSSQAQGRSQEPQKQSRPPSYPQTLEHQGHSKPRDFQSIHMGTSFHGQEISQYTPPIPSVGLPARPRSGERMDMDRPPSRSQARSRSQERQLDGVGFGHQDSRESLSSSRDGSFTGPLSYRESSTGREVPRSRGNSRPPSVNRHSAEILNPPREVFQSNPYAHLQEQHDRNRPFSRGPPKDTMF